jgi:hypothetical protein
MEEQQEKVKEEKVAIQTLDLLRHDQLLKLCNISRRTTSGIKFNSALNSCALVDNNSMLNMITTNYLCTECMCIIASACHSYNYYSVLMNIMENFKVEV